MATTDRARFNAALNEAEAAMTAMFGEMAREIGAVVLAEAGQDGTVPVERLRYIQQRAGRIVDRYMVGARRQPIDDEGLPGSPFAAIISEGQGEMTDIALERSAALWEQLPEDLLARLRARLG